MIRISTVQFSLSERNANHLFAVPDYKSGTAAFNFTLLFGICNSEALS